MSPSKGNDEARFERLIKVSTIVPQSPNKKAQSTSHDSDSQDKVIVNTPLGSKFSRFASNIIPEANKTQNSNKVIVNSPLVAKISRPANLNPEANEVSYNSDKVIINYIIPPPCKIVQVINELPSSIVVVNQKVAPSPKKISSAYDSADNSVLSDRVVVSTRFLSAPRQISAESNVNPQPIKSLVSNLNSSRVQDHVDGQISNSIHNVMTRSNKISVSPIVAPCNPANTNLKNNQQTLPNIIIVAPVVQSPRISLNQHQQTFNNAENIVAPVTRAQSLDQYRSNSEMPFNGELGASSLDVNKSPSKRALSRRIMESKLLELSRKRVLQESSKKSSETLITEYDSRLASSYYTDKSLGGFIEKDEESDELCSMGKENVVDQGADWKRMRIDF